MDPARNRLAPADDHTLPPTAEYLASLPSKWIASAIVVLNDLGQVLLVDPVYKAGHELPGGTVEADESPLDAAGREGTEELGIDTTPGRLLVIDYVPSDETGRPDGLVFLFDGGTLGADDIARVRVPADELAGFCWADESTADTLLTDQQGRRLRAALQARATASVIYLENGHPRPAGHATPTEP